MGKPGIYGRTVTARDFHDNPDKWFRIACKEGAITVVDSKGNPQSVISVPGPLPCCDHCIERALAAIDSVVANYPTDIFPEDGKSKDCESARWFRHILRVAREDVEKAMREGDE